MITLKETVLLSEVPDVAIFWYDSSWGHRNMLPVNTHTHTYSLKFYFASWIFAKFGDPYIELQIASKFLFLYM